MIIKSLELKNYDELSMNFASGTNLLYGDNAQGKTNILESIYLSATTKSHRGNKDRELIKFEENEAHIRIHFEKQGIDHQLDMHLKKNKAKGVAIDKIPIRRSSDLLGQIPVILFSPEDLKIVKSGPSERRKFLDIELSQMERLYLYQLTNYNKILIQRNNLLKQIRFQNNLIDTLEAWDIQLVKYGSEVIKYREKFIKHLGEVCQKIHNKLTGGKEQILLEYDRNVGYDSYLTELKKKRQKDLKYFTTTVGPHRDDISFVVNGIDINIWNPSTDKLLKANYDAKTAIENKKKNKKALQESLGLEVDEHKMVIGLISRLTNQKGLDLVNDVIPGVMDGNTQVVVLGTGDSWYEEAFRSYENQYKGSFCAYIAYDENVAHNIYSGCDALLVPSRFEPCGLTQLIAMRYGAIPIVRETGGLRDTVWPYNMFDNTGNGFTFDRYESGLLYDTINRAKTCYFENRASWDDMVIRDMNKDVSWETSARQYKDMYVELTPR